jgi:ribosomal protein L19
MVSYNFYTRTLYTALQSRSITIINEFCLSTTFKTCDFPIKVTGCEKLIGISSRQVQLSIVNCNKVTENCHKYLRQMTSRCA